MGFEFQKLLFSSSFVGLWPARAKLHLTAQQMNIIKNILLLRSCCCYFFFTFLMIVIFLPKKIGPCVYTSIPAYWRGVSFCKWPPLPLSSQMSYKKVELKGFQKNLDNSTHFMSSSKTSHAHELVTVVQSSGQKKTQCLLSSMMKDKRHACHLTYVTLLTAKGNYKC